MGWRADGQLLAPGKGVDWVIGLGKARPDTMVAESGALTRHAIERSSAPEKVFLRPGYDAIDSGRDVRKLTGDGIRLEEAAFDPARSHEQNILASVLGLLGVPALMPAGPNRE